MSESIPLIVVCGPTASGKSEAGLILAQRWNTEIISADSRQIYKFLDIGTAKPPKKDLNLVKHHLIDIITPAEQYNAGRFEKDALPIIKSLMERGKVPIMIGGTGLYIKALVYGLFKGPSSNSKIKTSLINTLKERGVMHLYQKLKEIDPKAAKRLHPNDKQRIIRALEVFYSTGQTITSLQDADTPKEQLFPSIILVLFRPRDVLYSRIEKRVDLMIQQGFIEEVRELLNLGYNKYDPGMESLGYKIIIDYLENKITLNEAISLLKRDTRRYAKRQITWFKQDKFAHHIQITNSLSATDIADRLKKCIESVFPNLPLPA